MATDIIARGMATKALAQDGTSNYAALTNKPSINGVELSGNKTAEELMGQLKGWLDSYVKLGEHLERASVAYADSKKKLTDSNQSVVKKISKLEKLGLAPKRSAGRVRANARLAGPESVIPPALQDPSEE